MRKILTKNNELAVICISHNEYILFIDKKYIKLNDWLENRIILLNKYSDLISDKCKEYNITDPVLNKYYMEFYSIIEDSILLLIDCKIFLEDKTEYQIFETKASLIKNIIDVFYTQQILTESLMKEFPDEEDLKEEY